MIVRRSDFAQREAQDRLARQDAVLDDPEDRAADQLVRAGRAEAGDERNDPVLRAQGLPPGERLDAGAAERDLADVEGHGIVLLD